MDSLIKSQSKGFKTKELPKGKININRADVKEFEKLPGIGLKTAEKIVEYRNKIKFFKNTAQLKNVKGISEGKFAKLKDYIFVE